MRTSFHFAIPKDLQDSSYSCSVGLQGVCSRQALPFTHQAHLPKRRDGVLQSTQITNWHRKIPHNAFLVAVVKVSLIFRVQSIH